MSEIYLPYGFDLSDRSTWTDGTAERAGTRPHGLAVSYAQHHLLRAHPQWDIPMSREDQDEHLRKILGAAGHPQADEAFTLPHPRPEKNASNPAYMPDGTPGVVLHPHASPRLTLAHEAAHIMYDRETGRKPNAQTPDSESHGPGFLRHYRNMLGLSGRPDRKELDTFMQHYRDAHQAIVGSAAPEFEETEHTRPQEVQESDAARAFRERMRQRRQAGANGDLPEGLTFSHEQVMDGKLHHMIARHPDAPHQEMWGNHVGRITWWSSDGEVSNLHVEPQYQRRGVATELWNRAKAVQPDLKHSEEQTEEGASWARTTAAYSQDHDWLPSGRYWGPNSAQNDQRLFEGSHLRPEVREYLLDRVNSFLRPRYRNWPSWTRVYFAGSEAARWDGWNGDFDVLLGADFDRFRRENPEHAREDDAAIAKTITDGMWHSLNEDGHWFTLADGQRVGPFDITFFLNPRAWDIRDLKPYAAYNVTADEWAVHPLEVPKDWSAKKLPESFWIYAESLLNEIKAIGQLPPEERHRMAANLFEELHSHRSDAFNGDGKGLYDLSNITEKYLDQHPDKPWEKLKNWANQAPSGPSPWVPTTARRTLTSLFAKKEPEGADHDGIMVAVVPPKSIGKKLLVKGGEPLESLHVTLVYLGKSGEHTKDQMEALEPLVRAWARMQKPLTGKIGGAGTFHNPGEHVLMAHVDIPHGGGVRHSLSELLEEHGYKVRNDHGWTPHITLKYHKHPVRFLPKVEPVTWDIKDIVLCVGGKWTPIPLGA